MVVLTVRATLEKNAAIDSDAYSLSPGASNLDSGAHRPKSSCAVVKNQPHQILQLVR
jgi:hypothetical protein